MDRLELLRILNLVAPAVSDQDLVPVLSCIHFSAAVVTAFNESMAIRVAYETPLTGSIHAERLIGFLSKTSGAQVEVEVNDSADRVKVVVGRARMELPLLDTPTIATFDGLPEVGECCSIPLSEDLLRGLKLCLLSVGSGRLHPEHAGITLRVDDQGAVLFSTDDSTISCYMLGDPVSSVDLSTILPAEFCKQVIRLAQPPVGVLYLTETEVFVDLPEASVLLYAKLQGDLTPPDFGAVVASHITGDTVFIPHPEDLHPALTRALLLAGKSTAQASQFAIADQVLEMRSESGGAKIDDTIPLTDGIVACNFRADPRLLARGCQSTHEVVFSERFTGMMDDTGQFLYLVSHFDSAEG